MKDMSSAKLNWPAQGNFVGGFGAGRSTHSSAWDALADGSADKTESTEEVQDEGSEPSGEGSE